MHPDMAGTLFDPDPGRAAVISADGLYRYTLTRRWGEGPTVNFLMLNPSTANATDDDPTLRRCMGYARRWGYGGLVVTNLFALRSTDPAALKGHPDPVGPENDRHLVEQAGSAVLVVCAWGNHGTLLGRADRVRELLKYAAVQPHRLTMTGRGQPAHPLRLRADLKSGPMPPWIPT